MKEQKSENKEVCKKCNTKMKVISRVKRLLDRHELGGDLSDGEESEYIAADLGGDSSEFEITQIEYKCPKCDNTKIVETL